MRPLRPRSNEQLAPIDIGGYLVNGLARSSELNSERDRVDDLPPGKIKSCPSPVVSLRYLFSSCLSLASCAARPTGRETIASSTPDSSWNGG